jgi:hypothetical protein
MANRLRGNGRGPGRRKKSEGEDPQTPTSANPAQVADGHQASDAKKPLPNVTDETMQELGLEYKVAREELQKSVDEQRKIRANVQAIKKRAKKLGVDPEYLSRWYDMRLRDPNEVAKEVAEFNRFLLAMRYPVGYQLGLFEDGETVATKIDKQSQPAPTTPESVQAAWHEGFAAAEAGKSIASNPHPLESAEWKGFEDGYSAQQAKLARSMGAPASESATVQ